MALEKHIHCCDHCPHLQVVFLPHSVSNTESHQGEVEVVFKVMGEAQIPSFPSQSGPLGQHACIHLLPGGPVPSKPSLVILWPKLAFYISFALTLLLGPGPHHPAPCYLQSVVHSLPIRDQLIEGRQIKVLAE